MYGLPVARASFRSYLAGHVKELGYQPCLTDCDVHYRAAKKANGVEYYQYCVCYVDDILVVHHETLSVLERIDKYFALKPESVEGSRHVLGS